MTLFSASRNVANAFKQRLIRLRSNLGDRKHIANCFVRLARGTFIGYAIGFAVLPVLTRLYSPEEFGLANLATNFLAFALLVVSLRYDFAIVSAAEEDDAAHLTVLTVVLTVPLGLLTCGLLWLLITQQWLGFGAMPLEMLPLMIIGLWIASWFNSLRMLMLKRERYGLIGWLTIWQNTGRAGTQTGLGLLAMGWWGIFIGEIVGRFLGIGRIWRTVRSVLTNTWRPGICSRLWSTCGRFKDFPLWSFPSSVLNTLVILLPLPILTSLYGLEQAGLYALANRVLSVPIGLIGKNVGEVFHARLAVTCKEEPHAATKLLLQTSKLLVLLGTIPTLSIMILSPLVFGFVFGDDWREAGVITTIVSPWIFTQFVVSAVSRAIFVVGGMKLKFLYDVITLVGVVAIPVAVASMGKGMFLETVAALSAFKTFSYIVYFFVLLKCVRSFVKARAIDTRTTN